MLYVRNKTGWLLTWSSNSKPNPFACLHSTCVAVPYVYGISIIPYEPTFVYSTSGLYCTFCNELLPKTNSGERVLRIPQWKDILKHTYKLNIILLIWKSCCLRYFLTEKKIHQRTNTIFLYYHNNN